MVEEFGEQFERTAPRWQRFDDSNMYNNTSPSSQSGSGHIPVMPMADILRDSASDQRKPTSEVWAEPERRAPQHCLLRKTCGIANATICIIVITLLALLLVGAIIAIVVIVVKQSDSKITPEIITRPASTNITSPTSNDMTSPISTDITSPISTDITSPTLTTTTNPTTTTTTTPPPLVCSITSTTYNVSTDGGLTSVVSFQSNPRKPDGFIVVAGDLMNVYEFKTTNLNSNTKILSLDNKAEMIHCKLFALKDLCDGRGCGEKDITYCVEQCQNGTVDFCKMGGVKLEGRSPYLIGANAFVDKYNQFQMDVFTKNDQPSCLMNLTILETYNSSRVVNIIPCDDFSAEPQYKTLAATGNEREISWIAAVNGSGIINAMRLSDKAHFTSNKTIYSNATKLSITPIDDYSAQVAAFDNNTIRIYRFGDSFHPVLYAHQEISLKEGSLWTVSSDGTVNVLTYVDSKTLRLQIYSISWK